MSTIPRGPIARQSGQGPRVAIVGPCGSGKSTIAHRLRERGIDARMPAQEHSGVPAMWLKLLAPDLLVALDAPNRVLQARREGIGLSDALLAAQRTRLAHAAAHAHLTFDSSRASEDEIESAILEWLSQSSR